MYSETYQLGLDRNILTDRNRIRFFDIDGVLSTYAYGADGINAVSDQEFDQFVEHVDLYQKAEGSLLLREYLETYTDPALNYVVSQSGTLPRTIRNDISFPGFIMDISRKIIFSFPELPKKPRS